jgi:hypothetical protein
VRLRVHPIWRTYWPSADKRDSSRT